MSGKSVTPPRGSLRREASNRPGHQVLPGSASESRRDVSAHTETAPHSSASTARPCLRHRGDRPWVGRETYRIRSYAPINADGRFDACAQILRPEAKRLITLVHA